jgi:hypothetical protein
LKQKQNNSRAQKGATRFKSRYKYSAHILVTFHFIVTFIITISIVTFILLRCQKAYTRNFCFYQSFLRGGGDIREADYSSFSREQLRRLASTEHFHSITSTVEIVISLLLMRCKNNGTMHDMLPVQMVTSMCMWSAEKKQNHMSVT